MPTFNITIANKEQLIELDHAIYNASKQSPYLADVYESLQDQWNEILEAFEEEEYLATI
jgi:hypothetical protein